MTTEVSVIPKSVRLVHIIYKPFMRLATDVFYQYRWLSWQPCSGSKYPNGGGRAVYSVIEASTIHHPQRSCSDRRRAQNAGEISRGLERKMGSPSHDQSPVLVVVVVQAWRRRGPFPQAKEISQCGVSSTSVTVRYTSIISVGHNLWDIKQGCVFAICRISCIR